MQEQKYVSGEIEVTQRHYGLSNCILSKLLDSELRIYQTGKNRTVYLLDFLRGRSNVLVTQNKIKLNHVPRRVFSKLEEFFGTSREGELN